MFGLSRLVSLIIVFTMGFGLATGLFLGIPAAVVMNYSLRDLEATQLVNIPDEQFFNPPEDGVDLLALNGLELYKHIQDLKTVASEERLTLRYLRDLYGIIFHEKLTKMLPEDGEAMNMPLNKLLSMEGVHSILSNVYIGDMQNYQCMKRVDDTWVAADAGDPDSYWFVINTDSDGNESKKQISGVEEILADFTLDDFISGNINTDAILHGGITLADVLGYQQGDDGNWYETASDGTTKRVTGIMAVFADCNLENVDEKINTVELGELLSYTRGEDGYWYETKEDGTTKQVTGLMAVVADRNMQNLGGIYDDLTIGDIVAEDQRTGIFAILSPEAHLNNIAGEINTSIMNSPLQFFINENLITFEDTSSILDEMAVYNGMTQEEFMDLLAGCEEKQWGMKKLFYDAYKETNLYAYILHVEEGEEGYDEFLKLKGYYEFNVSKDKATGEKVYTDLWEQVEVDGVTMYRVPAWRTQQLNASFSYIISLLSCMAPEYPSEPINTPAEVVDPEVEVDSEIEIDPEVDE